MCNVAHFTKKKKKKKKRNSRILDTKRNHNAFLAIYSKLHELTITLIIMWEQNFSQTSMFYAVV